ncbi:MAG: hypothetical protein EP343_05830 [Deltaproteobacteria bacterium]|nr:MAG: hypothetical protein EP343_05830 [Deltaproteobacteria bacterium]
MQRFFLVVILFVALAFGGLLDCSNRTNSCGQECTQGQSYCSQSGLVVCDIDYTTRCFQWKVKPCSVGEVCSEQPPPASCRGQKTCDKAFFQKQCSGQDLFWADNCGRLREKILTCPSHTVCRGGVCERGTAGNVNNNNSGSCTDQCKLGEKQCTSNGLVSYCSPSSRNACTEWSAPVPCPNQRYCANGSCSQESCQNACLLGQKRCLSQQVQVCENGSKGCTVWGAAYPCLPGQACQGDGQCAPAKGCYDACTESETRCSGDFIQVCRKKANGCLEWDQPQACPAGQKCLERYCREPKTCQDECQNGATRCSGVQIQVCQRGSQGCTVWGKAYPCLSGQSCRNGQCVADGCPGTCASNNDCQTALCGSRNTCNNAKCVLPQPQCPPSCTQDTDCYTLGCGSRTSCVNGTCQARQTQCPPSCTQDSQCQIPACGSWNTCVNGRCGLPQDQCPPSCSQDSQCQVSGCGSRRYCRSGQCSSSPPPEPPRDTAPGPDAGNGPEPGPEPPPQDTNNNTGWKYGTNLKFSNFPKQNSRTNSAWGPVLTDIVNHEAPGDNNPYSDLVTKGHETCHGIHSHLRNNYNNTGKKANAFYLLQGRYIVIEEPPMRKSVVGAFVPSNLRGSRYNLYIAGSQSWDDRPLYIYDEWVAYVNGAASGVDIAKLGKWTYGWRDAVMGPLEFSVYGIATAMAAEKHASSYFQNYPLFLHFTAWLVAESMKYYREGAVMTDFKWAKQDTYLQNLQTSAAAKPMRDWCARVFGQKWVDQVIFGKP